MIEQYSLQSLDPETGDNLLGTSSAPSQDTSRDVEPSRWQTREFYFYYVCFAIIIPFMLRTVYGLGLEDSPNYAAFAPLLSEGWLFGRKVDNSDAQYAQFRNNFPTLALLACVYLGASHCYRFCLMSRKGTDRTMHRVYFFLVASISILIGLHGANAIKVLTITTVSYGIGYCTHGSVWNPVATWAWNIAILFLNEYYEGYRFSWLSPSLAWLDDWQGALPRWHVLFNFCVLRLISFNMDYYWQCKKPRSHYQSAQEQEAKLDESFTTDKERITVPCFASDYSYTHFLAYTLYTPLYICGPVMSFNNFISQVRSPSAKVHVNSIALYALRLLGAMLVMEITLHYVYVVAISKTKAWQGDTPFQMSMIGYFNLVIIWLKLLIPWRFFRLWALADGLWPEENMIRCVSNNYSAQRFWKSWHRSLNRWIIRYVFIPLGGSRYMMFNMWAVFTFVALWHDIELKLLAWGWLICLFLLPELIASRLFSFKKYGHRPYYRTVCALGAVANIFMMMVANLVGFCLGIDGMKEMLAQMFSTLNGLVFLVSAVFSLFIAVQVMFEIRNSERRRGDPKWTM